MTWHRQGVELIVDRALKEPTGKELRKQLHRIRREWLQGLFTLGDVIGQQPSYLKWDIYDAYAFAAVHAMLDDGLVFAVKIEVGSTPTADLKVTENQRRLDEIAEPFSATFLGRAGYDFDGYLNWNEPIKLGHVFQSSLKLITPDQFKCVALEVGFTKPSRTLTHLKTEFGVARWPYNSSYIYLLVRSDVTRWFRTN